MAPAARAIFAAATLFASVAHAHPLVDEGRRLYDEAEFDAAMDALTRAEQANDLTRADLIELLRIRILLRVAMEQPEGLEADAERLLSLDPHFDFGESAPPEVTEAVARM